MQGEKEVEEDSIEGSLGWQVPTEGSESAAHQPRGQGVEWVFQSYLERDRFARKLETKFFW